MEIGRWLIRNRTSIGVGYRSWYNGTIDRIIIKKRFNFRRDSDTHGNRSCVRRGCFLCVVKSTGAGARPLGILATLPGSSFVIAEIKLNDRFLSCYRRKNVLARLTNNLRTKKKWTRVILTSEHLRCTYEFQDDSRLPKTFDTVVSRKAETFTLTRGKNERREAIRSRNKLL